MDIKIKTNAKSLQARYSKFIHKLPKIIQQGLEDAGAFLSEAQKVRTDRGLDVNRKTFISYSPAYAELKGKSRVDLQDTNRMLQSISHKLISRNKAQIYFRSQAEAEKGFYHQTGAGRLPVRKFFGFDKRLEKQVNKNFVKFLERKIKGMNI